MSGSGVALEYLSMHLHDLYYKIKMGGATPEDCERQCRIIIAVLKERNIPASHKFGIEDLTKEYFRTAILDGGATKEGFLDYLIKNMNSW